MKNFLFDFDGTLADTLPLCITAFREAIEPLAGRSLSDADIIETFGPSEEGTIAALLPDNESVGMTAYLERYAALHGNWPAPFPGIPELLHYLKEKGAFVGLITGKGPQSAALSLEHYDMGAFFQTVQTGDRSGPVKEQRIAHVIEAYDLDPAETLYIGDAPSDITASHACGIRVAAAAWAASADVEALQALSPDYLFTSLEDFYTFIHCLFE
ncbi:HAD hydrolase-like protein [Ruficoccus sp. ZRK36]|uniref:HAD family hydrolase n=1 Tax=Ruficoccus sp. ZRK36 TaxID=2866311 RepID=UPI001C72B809|nr:HAD hydrolase-like protein [Ruficoccus sp. ZRK36]QYY36604.1 HAD family hydrolase [Ruficoccus sp. ZRK36]